MRSVTEVAWRLIDTIPEDDPDKKMFVRLVDNTLRDQMYVAPDATHLTWMRLRDILLTLYPREHRHHRALSSIFVGDHPLAGAEKESSPLR